MCKMGVTRLNETLRLGAIEKRVPIGRIWENHPKGTALIPSFSKTSLPEGLGVFRLFVKSIAT